ncbi:hypothetical protein ACFPK9_04690 [Rubritalea spongiae]|uniref:Uncharacterized protein n=1 Tax=Rubritalea spongiae TaxID=430797 RepID=A0ABW5E6I8_9BACT
MDTQEIQEYIDTAIRSSFENFTTETAEVMTSPQGDGRFFGKVSATRYSDLPIGKDVFLAIGKSEKLVQIVRLGKAECLGPGKADLDLMLEKEFGIKCPE